VGQAIVGLAAALVFVYTVNTGAEPTAADLAEWQRPTRASRIVGDAAFYGARHNMATIAGRRGLSLEGMAGGVALMRCGDLGRVVWIRIRGRWRGPFRVVDCSRRDHYALNVARGRAVDLGWATWQALSLPADLVPVVVSFRPPTGRPGPGPRRR
jgi:hypothetical protein